MNSQKLNIGCGADKRQGWINLDALPDFAPDVVHDLHLPLPFKNSTFSTILARDILEHFTYQTLETHLLPELSRISKNNGRLLVRIPNVDAISQKFETDKPTRNIFLYGNTEHTGVFGAHKVGLTKQQLTKLMKLQGLYPLKIEEIDTNFVAEFRKQPQPKLKKIIHINHSQSFGGAEIFLTNLFAALKKNHQVGVDSYTSSPIFHSTLTKHKLSSTKLAVNIDIASNYRGLTKAILKFPWAVVVYWKILNRAKKNKTQLVLLSGYSEKILVTPLASLLGMKVVWIEFGPLSPLFIKLWQLPKLLYLLIKHLPETIIVPSQSSKQAVIDQGKISLAKIETVTCGSVPTKSRVTKNENTIVCISRIEPGKGQDILIQAFAKIRHKFPKTKLLLIGSGDPEFTQKLKTLIHKFNLTDQVVLTGFVEETQSYLASAKVCVFPSVWNLEGFGLVVTEAMALQKPIIAFNHGPLPELILHRQNGLLADPNKPVTSLSKSLETMLADTRLRNKLAKAAAKTFAEKYDIQISAQKYYSVLRKAIC